jgi:CRP/FNR family transcriptional regulator
MEEMCMSKTERQFEKGELIIREGDLIEDFIYLKSGLVKLFRQGSNNKEQIICFAGPLDFVSLLSIFSETQYHYSVAALENSVTCSLKLKEVKTIASENGAFALNLVEKINRASDKIIIDFLEVKQRRLLGRIAFLLIYFAQEVYQSNTFTLPVSRKEMAEYIGMTIENVIRTLSDFRKDGIIKINGSIIEIADMERLKRIRDLN